MKKAVIFDFDYTLGDSTEGIVLSANYAFEKLGYEAKETERIQRTIGLPLKETFMQLEYSSNESEAEEFATYFKQKADDVMVAHTRLYKGVEDSLKKLREQGYKVGIVTTKYRYRIEAIFSKYEALDLLDFIVGGDNVKIEKPDPEGLLWAVEHLGVEKEEVLYVGDSIVDAKTAQNAGIAFIGVLTGTTGKEDFAIYPYEKLCKDIRDVYRYISSLE